MIRVLSAHLLARPWLVAAIVLAAVVRLAPAIGADFPIGDGGLFAQMVVDLRENGLIPPPEVSYYGVPWVYPPLGIYLVALIPGDPVAHLRWMPIVWSLAIVPAVWLLLRAVVEPRIADVASVAYALLSWGAYWLVQGGGVTRGPGQLFAIMAMWALMRERFVLLGVFGGLTVITHPEAAAFGAVGVFVLWIARSRQPRAFIAMPIAAAIAAVWVVPLVLTRGPEPIFWAAGTRDVLPVAATVTLFTTHVDPVTLLAGVGVVVSAWRRQWVLLVLAVAWLLVPGDPRRWMAIPFSALAAVAFLAMVGQPRLRPVAHAAAVAAVVLAPLLMSRSLTVISPAVRDELIRLRAATDVVYAVDSGREVTEWFSFLTQKATVTAPYGAEWVDPAEVQARYGDVEDFRACETDSCRRDWAEAHGADRIYAD